MKQFVLIARFKKLPSPLVYCLANDKYEAAVVFCKRLNQYSRINWRPEVIQSFVKQDSGQQPLFIS